MCRYEDRGMLVVDSSEKLAAVKKALQKEPLKVKNAKQARSDFKVEFWK